MYIYLFIRLDPALIRPGRVDIKQIVDYATEYQLQQMYRRFYPDQTDEQAMLFSEKALAQGENISLAQVQGLFLKYKSDPQGVINNIDQI